MDAQRVRRGFSPDTHRRLEGEWVWPGYARDFISGRKALPRTEVRDSLAGGGHGLFAVDEVKAGSAVIEYAGRVLLLKEGMTSKYLVKLDYTDGRYVIDAGARKSGDARFIQGITFEDDSPNCEVSCGRARATSHSGSLTVALSLRVSHLWV